MERSCGRVERWFARAVRLYGRAERWFARAERPSVRLVERRGDGLPGLARRLDALHGQSAARPEPPGQAA